MNCEADEAMLTGESVPVSKNAEMIFSAEKAKQGEIGVGDRSNMAYSTSCITRGRATGIVIGTGLHTEIGAIAQSLAQSESRIRKPKL
jgi:P-type Na+/K+ transporter